MPPPTDFTQGPPEVFESHDRDNPTGLIEDSVAAPRVGKDVDSSAISIEESRKAFESAHATWMRDHSQALRPRAALPPPSEMSAMPGRLKKFEAPIEKLARLEAEVAEFRTTLVELGDSAPSSLPVREILQRLSVLEGTLDDSKTDPIITAPITSNTPVITKAQHLISTLASSSALREAPSISRVEHDALVRRMEEVEKLMEPSALQMSLSTAENALNAVTPEILIAFRERTKAIQQAASKLEGDVKDDAQFGLSDLAARIEDLSTAHNVQVSSANLLSESKKQQLTNAEALQHLNEKVNEVMSSFETNSITMLSNLDILQQRLSTAEHLAAQLPQ